MYSDILPELPPVFMVIGVLSWRSFFCGRTNYAAGGLVNRGLISRCVDCLIAFLLFMIFIGEFDPSLGMYKLPHICVNLYV